MERTTWKTGKLNYCAEKTIAPLFKGALYSSESSLRDRPLIGFCMELLLGCKWVLFCVCLLLCSVYGAQVGGGGLWLFVFGISTPVIIAIVAVLVAVIAAAAVVLVRRRK